MKVMQPVHITCLAVGSHLDPPSVLNGDMSADLQVKTGRSPSIQGYRNMNESVLNEFVDHFISETRSTIQRLCFYIHLFGTSWPTLPHINL